MLQKGGPFPGLKSGPLSNTWKWIVQGDTHAGKARDFIETGHPSRKRRGKGSQEDCSALWLRFYGDGISFQVVSGHSFWLQVLPGGTTSLSQDRFQWERFWKVGRTYGLALPLSFWPFLNYSSWSWLISSMFFTRTFCHKITHLNGYCGAWPGWAVLVSGSPKIATSSKCWVE